MGFALYYRSTKALSPRHAKAIRDAAVTLSEGRTWLSCEPIKFHKSQEDGRLAGGSKPNFLPDLEDVESALQMSQPDGTVRHLVDILCKLSNDFDVDWELSHDHEHRPIGYIRDGICEERLLEKVDALVELREFAREFADDDDDAEPTILPFPPR